MVQRLAQVVRYLLLALGVAMVMSLPASYVWAVYLQCPLPLDRAGGLFLDRGVVTVALDLDGPQTVFEPLARIRLHTFAVSEITERGIESPKRFSFWMSTGTTWISFPLWLLAAICLAWPVTSFLLARRRRKRGFPIEPATPATTPGPAAR